MSRAAFSQAPRTARKDMVSGVTPSRVDASGLPLVMELPKVHTKLLRDTSE